VAGVPLTVEFQTVRTRTRTAICSLSLEERMDDAQVGPQSRGPTRVVDGFYTLTRGRSTAGTCSGGANALVRGVR
jgi:hypothetical protein